MKNQILDTPFREQISDALTKGEKILWSEKPKKKNWFSWFDIIVILFSIGLLISYQAFSKVQSFPILVGGSFLLLLLSSKAREFLEVQNTFYAITQKRIFFQIQAQKEKKIFSIPLSEIENLSITNDSILIRTKNLTSPYLENYNEAKEDSTHHPLPIIENIRDVEEVVQILRNELQNLKLLQ